MRQGLRANQGHSVAPKLQLRGATIGKSHATESVTADEAELRRHGRYQAGAW